MFYNSINLTDLNGFVNWDVSEVTIFQSLFQYYEKITYFNALSNWNVESATDMTSMFLECTGIIDTSGINNWDIRSVTSFTKMFKNTPVHPEFTQVTGTWSSDGTFTPST